MKKYLLSSYDLSQLSFLCCDNKWYVVKKNISSVEKKRHDFKCSPASGEIPLNVKWKMFLCGVEYETVTSLALFYCVKTPESVIRIVFSDILVIYVLYVCYSQTTMFCSGWCFEDIFRSDGMKMYIHMKVLRFVLFVDISWTFSWL